MGESPIRPFIYDNLHELIVNNKNRRNELEIMYDMYVKTEKNHLNTHSIKNLNMKFINIDHIYIVHCTQYQDRYEYLKNKFNQLNISEDYYDFVVNTHKNDITDETISKYYTTDTDIRHKELKIIGEDKYLTKDISKGCISCGINHINIWEKINTSEYKNVLVLEDDIIFDESTIKNLVEATMQLPERFSICSLEEGAGLKVTNYITRNIDPDKMFYKVPDGRMRCTGAYIINKETCHRLLTLNEKRRFSLEIDMQLWLYGKLKLLEIYWVYPYIFTQGSQNGTYVSGIQNIECKENHNLIQSNVQRIKDHIGIESNRRCIEIKNNNDEQLHSRCLVEKHNFSTLILGNNKGVVNHMNTILSIKFEEISKTDTYESIARLIKKNYFEGVLDLLVMDKYDSNFIQFLINTSIIINPKIIMINLPIDNNFIHEAYEYCSTMNMYIKK